MLVSFQVFSFVTSWFDESSIADNNWFFTWWMVSDIYTRFHESFMAIIQHHCIYRYLLLKYSILMEHLYLKIFVDLLLYDFIPIYNVPRRTYNLKNISLSADIYNCFFVI